MKARCLSLATETDEKGGALGRREAVARNEISQGPCDPSVFIAFGPSGPSAWSLSRFPQH